MINLALSPSSSLIGWVAGLCSLSARCTYATVFTSLLELLNRSHRFFLFHKVWCGYSFFSSGAKIRLICAGHSLFGRFNQASPLSHFFLYSYSMLIALVLMHALLFIQLFSSMCTFLTVRHLNKKHDRFLFLRLIFTVKGPKYSTITFVKAVEISTCSLGRTALTGVSVCDLAFLHITHLLLSDRRAFGMPRIHIFCWTLFHTCSVPSFWLFFRFFANTIQLDGESHVGILGSFHWNPNDFCLFWFGTNELFFVKEGYNL